MSTFLRQLCQGIPSGECSREAWEDNSHDPTGTGSTNNARKLQRSESLSSDGSTRRRCMQGLWWYKHYRLRGSGPEFVVWFQRGSTHKSLTDKRTEDNDEILKELTATFRDEDKKGPPISKQLAEMANKQWGKKLEQDKMSSLLGKYDTPENCVDKTVTRVNPEIWQSLTLSERRPTSGSQICNRSSGGQHLRPSQMQTNGSELLI